jgi:hypothetical protein
VRRKITVLISAVACAVPLVALTAGSAHADTITPIKQLSGFNQMVVDTAVSPNYIFMSGGGSIVVTDLSGKYVATLDSGDGVAGIALAPDGKTVYAALTAGTGVADEVAAITVSTITAKTPTQATYKLGTGDVPHSLAVQSGTLWVSYQGTAATDPGAIGNIDLTTGTFTAATAPGSWSSAPDLAADPSNTGVLVAVLPGSAATAATFSTTATAAKTMAGQAKLGATGHQCEYEHQIAVVPGGKEFIAACESPQNENAYSTEDLSVQATYDTGAGDPGGVAVDADGTVAVGTYGTGSNIRVYDPDGTLLNVFTLGKSRQIVAMDGLAWEDTTPQPELAAMEQPSGPFTLKVFDQPRVTRSALTLTMRSSRIYIGKSVTLTGTLAFDAGSVPAHTKLTVTRTGHGASKQFTVTTGTKGAFRVTDTPTATGTYTYTVRYGGSATTAPAAASRKVSVTLNAAVLSVSTNGTVFTYEPTVRITAHLGATYRNRSVRVYARWFGSKASTLIKTGKVDSRGALTVSYRAPHSTTFRVVFSGDAHYAAKTVTRAVYVRAKVSESISGYYGSKSVHGTLYRLYHSSDLLYSAASVAPDKHGQCVKFEVQEYYESAWHSNVTTVCVSLSASSHATADFDLAHADHGYPYRVRADYLRSTRDTSNESADSGWLYLMVES